MLSITGLTKFYGEQTLFEEVNLNIGEKEKIGLIGRNGSGKSTFLKILLGVESAQEGEVKIPNDYRIRALEQNLQFSENTVLSQVINSLDTCSKNEDWKAKSILMGLGFDEEDFNRSPFEFSSGFQVRIRLAEALVSDSDLLLLDEPTNYLDLLSLRWLEGFLKNWNKSFILVTHDRNFMELVVSHSIAIHRKEMRKMKGGPIKLLEHIKKDEEIYEKTRKNQEKKLKKTQEFISKFRAGARSAGLVQSRIKSLNKQEIKTKLENIPIIKFNFKSIPCLSDSIVQADKISFAYKEKSIIKKFSISTFPGDSIGIVGRNGKGKSTLLKLLYKNLEPQEGTVRMPPTLKTAYYGMDSIKMLDPNKTILEELIMSQNTSEQEVRNLCGALLFRGDDVKKRIKNLSGGEKSRVCLGKVLLKPSQLLFLDEVTNHLDMESVEALIEAIKNYQGTVIFVSHNEYLLSKLAKRLIVFDAGRTDVFNITYSEFLRKIAWSEENEGIFKLTKESSSQKERYLEEKRIKKEIRLIKKELERMEKEIDSLEKKKIDVSNQIQKACEDKNSETIKSLGIELSDLENLIASDYELLEENLNLLEEKELSMNYGEEN